MRLFFALWPDDATRAALAGAAALLNLRDGRPVSRADLHLTLAFLGEVPETRVAALCAMAAALRATSFELDITAAGWWRRSRVAWLAPATVPLALTTLATALQQGAGIASEGAASYRPHVTVARTVRHPPTQPSAFSVHWAARDFALISSNSAATGARYQALGTWRLLD